MNAAPERQALAACLLLSILLHGLGALLVQPREQRQPPPVASNPLTVLIPGDGSLQAERKAADADNTEQKNLTPIPVEVPRSVAQAIDPLRFYSGSELDARAEPDKEIELYFPSLPAGSPQSAKLVLQLKIDETGLVVEATVLEATYPGLLDKHAIDAFRKLTFVPAKLNGVAVKSIKRIEVGFDDLRERGHSKSL